MRQRAAPPSFDSALNGDSDPIACFKGFDRVAKMIHATFQEMPMFCFTIMSLLLGFYFQIFNEVLLVGAPSILLATLIKTAFHRFVRVCARLLPAALCRPRPLWLSNTVRNLGGEWQDDCSFPSGHTTFVVTFCAVITQHTNESNAVVAGLCVAALVLITGLSRMYLGLHFPTDIIGGVLVGIAFPSFWFYLDLSNHLDACCLMALWGWTAGFIVIWSVLAAAVSWYRRKMDSISASSREWQQQGWQAYVAGCEKRGERPGQPKQLETQHVGGSSVAGVLFVFPVSKGLRKEVLKAYPLYNVASHAWSHRLVRLAIGMLGMAVVFALLIRGRSKISKTVRKFLAYALAAFWIIAATPCVTDYLLI